MEPEAPPGHGGEYPQPKVTAADSEEKIQPGPAEAQHKNRVRQVYQPGPQRLQKPVKKSKTHPQNRCPEGIAGGSRRGHQRRTRPNNPRSRISSKISAEICPSTAA
jgi:hypothetical protein